MDDPVQSSWMNDQAGRTVRLSEDALVRNERGTNITVFPRRYAIPKGPAIPKGHTVPEGHAIDFAALRSGQIAAMGKKNLVVKVPKTRIEFQIIPQHSVNIVLSKTTRNNLSDNF